MPTYQYACTTSGCGNEFELVQSFTDPAASECPVCGGPVRKRYGAVGVVFKGSGFYRTDSRKAAKDGAASTAAKDTSSKDTSAKETPSKDTSSTTSSNGTSTTAPSTSNGRTSSATTSTSKAAAPA